MESKLKRKPTYNTKTLDNGYTVWSRVNPEQKLGPEHVGKRVWVAGEFKTKKEFLKEFHQPGEKGWPEGGVVVRGQSHDRYYYNQKVRLHPDELKRRYRNDK
jgi:hypothetical protein